MYVDSSRGLICGGAGAAISPQEAAAAASRLPGRISFYCKDLQTGSTASFRAEESLCAASVIKLAVLTEAFFRIEEGFLDPHEEYVLRAEDKLPSCGAFTYMHEGLRVTMEDLYTAMIIHSDNTATNILLHRFGMEAVNRRMRSLGLSITTVNRLLFDGEAAARGLENQISAGEMAFLLEKMYKGELVSPKASKEMLQILKNQRLNGKIPFFLHGMGVPVAHKTGEDDGITHDVGIVYGSSPFILCFCGNNTDVPLFERFMQDMSLGIYRWFQGTHNA